jgi:3-hydroxyisobutyrate dehydrogenase-like beta-hydroxyacid dehydrogenase
MPEFGPDWESFGLIAVIGLGNIGIALAGRLVETGQDVRGVDLLAERREMWRDLTGLEAVEHLSYVPWEQVAHVLVIVRLTAEAEGVLQELDAVVAPGTTVFVSTTLEYDYARELGRYSGRPWRLIELPVSGGQGGARAGTLTVMAAGGLTADDEALLRSTIATNVVRFDRFGDATVVKLINNVLAGYNARAFADLLVVANDLGVNLRRLDDVVRTSSGGSWMASAFAVLVDDLLAKDVALLHDQLGGLPHISLDPDSDLIGNLGRARALLLAADAGA